MKCPHCGTDNPDDSKYCKECATSLNAFDEAPVSLTKTLQTQPYVFAGGSTLAGKYRIVEPIGKGGMGVVYKAEDIKLKRTVAVKFLPPELTEDSEAGERFLREAQAAAALSHPHICTVHEVNEAKNEPFIVMEYVEGESLKEKIHKGPLDQAEELDIAIQVAEGLEEAHGRGIIHRDVKPGNIMITSKGQAKVMDFGLAKVLGESLITKEAKTMGTAAYMSPEQVQGEPCDLRTDIWSLGVVLYEMLTGELPFKGDYEQSLMFAIVNREPEPLSKVGPGFSSDLENILGTALAKNPADRYRNMTDLIQDLRSVAEGMKPLRAKAPSAKGKILGIRKAIFYAGLVTIAALVVLAIIFLISRRGEVLDSLAVLPLENISGDPEQDGFALMLSDQVTADLYKVSALRVIPPQSVREYKKSEKSLKEIAKELKVKAILSGTVLRSENRVRLIARLIDPNQDRQIWAETFEKEISDIFFLQSDLSRAIVRGIKVAVSPEEGALLAGARKVIPKAYDLYLKAYQAYWLSGEWNLQTVMKAIGYLEQAVKIDPDYAQAYADMGGWYNDLVLNGYVSAEEVTPKAEAAVLKAMELDETLAAPHSSLGWIKFARWDFSGAEQGIRKAVELEPGNYAEQWSFNVFLNAIGKSEEAIVRQKRLEESSPTGFLQRLPFFYLCAGRYKEGLEEAKKAAEKDASLNNNQMLVLAYGLNGMHAEALSLMNEIMTSADAENDLDNLAVFGKALALSGKRVEALAMIEKIKSLTAQLKTDPSFPLAVVNTALGDKDRAFELLNIVYEKRLPTALYIRSHPHFHGLHGDPRYEELLREIGFKE